MQANVHRPNANLPPTSARYRVACYRSLHGIPLAHWNQVLQGRNLFLDHAFLKGLEGVADEGLQLRYAIIYDRQRPVGVVSFQVTDFVGPPLESLLDSTAGPLSVLGRRLRFLRQELSLKIMICGNAFCTGANGFAFVEDVDPDCATHALMAAVAAVRRSASDLGVGAVLFKEFQPGSHPLANRLTDHAYTELKAQPTLVLELDPEWQTFEDYLASLRSKFRVKARRAYSKSAQLEVRDLSIQDLARHEPRLRALYQAVLDRANYRLGKLPIRALRHFRQNLGDDFVLKGYFLGDQLVGFLSGFVNGHTLEAFLVGVDYRLNRKHGIYPRMLYDYLQVGIERGLSHIHYGRTAGEIKSAVGAVPVSLSCYVHHRRRVVNRMLPLLSNKVLLPSDPVRQPFRDPRGVMNQLWAPHCELAV